MDFWNILKALVFGIVEGITEWLPVSSTGHMILLEEFMPFSNIEKDFWDMFLVVVQLGAILAVIFLFERNKHPDETCFRMECEMWLARPILSSFAFLQWRGGTCAL